MLYLHCLVWLRSISHLATLQSQIQSNIEFRQWLLLILEHIIKCLASKNHHTQNLDQVSLDANDPITMPQFADLFRSDSEAIVRKLQIYLPSHNPTCYKYNIYHSRVYRFDFVLPILPKSKIDLNGTIWLKRDNIWVNSWNPAIAFLIQSNYNINLFHQVLKRCHPYIILQIMLSRIIVANIKELCQWQSWKKHLTIMTKI